MVTPGHESMHANPSRTEGGPLTLSTVSKEVNDALLHVNRHYFEKEASYLSEILSDQCVISI